MIIGHSVSVSLYFYFVIKIPNWQIPPPLSCFLGHSTTAKQYVKACHIHMSEDKTVCWCIICLCWCFVEFSRLNVPRNNIHMSDS